MGTLAAHLTSLVLQALMGKTRSAKTSRMEVTCSGGHGDDASLQSLALDNG